MIKVIVFDMAGTTVDENNTVYKTIHRAIEAESFMVDFPTVLLHAAGKEKLQAIRDVMAVILGKPAPDKLAQTIFKNFKNLLDETYKKGDFREQPGATEIFKYLKRKNIKVVLNTGYSRPVANLLLEKLDWKNSILIDLSITADDVKKGRPDPEMIHFSMKKMGITDPKAVAKIGDSIIDIEEGKNAGCGLTFGITTGAHTREQLATAAPDAVLDNLLELKNWV